jgi:hypothetical protein
MNVPSKTTDQNKGYPMKPKTKFPTRTGKLGRPTPEIADRGTLRMGGGVISAERPERKGAPAKK